jgi:hypothetical protein
MIRVFLALAALVSASMVSAQSVPTTQILVKVDPSKNWSLQKAGDRRYSIVFAGQKVRFPGGDLSGGKSRNRVNSITSRSGEFGTALDVNLACNCRVNARASGESLLILVSDRPSEPRSAAKPSKRKVADQKKAAEKKPATKKTPPKFFAFRPEPRNREPEQVTTESEQDALPEIAELDPSIPDQAEANEPVEIAEEVAAIEPELEDASDRVEAAKRQLLEQLTRAAEQGLVDFEDPLEEQSETAQEIANEAPEKTDQTEPQEPQTMTDSDPDPESMPKEEMEAASSEPEVTPEPKEQLAARTVFDKEWQERMERNAANRSERSCLPRSEFDVVRWSDDRSFDEQLSELRLSLYGEFDEPDHAVLKKMLRLYLRYGFGAEAVALAREFSDVRPNIGLLNDMALTLEGGEVSEEGILSEMQYCHALATMWRVASGLPLEEGEFDLLEDVSAEFSDMPIDLRRMLGPLIVENLLAYDQTDWSAKFLILIERAPGEHGDQYLLAKARISAEQGRFDAAEKLYKQLVDTSSELALPATIELVDMNVAQGRSFARGFDLNIETLLRETRGRPLARELLSRLSYVKADLGKLGEAFEIIRDNIGSSAGNEKIWRDAAHHIFSNAAPDEKRPSAYVEPIIGNLDLIAETDDMDAARLKNSRQLAELGLSNQALRVLAPVLPRAEGDTLKFASDLLYAQSRFGEAADILAEVEDSESYAKRLRALRADGAGSAAEELASSSSLSVEDSDLAFSLGDWSSAAQSDDPARRRLSQYMADRVIPRDTEPGEAANASDELDNSLATARSSLSGSSELRSILQQALGQ